MYKLFFIFSFMSILQNVSSQNLTWSFMHPVKKELVSFGEKGSVQEKLIEIGELPDPFYGKNEEKFSWIEKYDWEFFSTVKIDKKELDREFVEIVFPNIDTYAKVYFNGKLVLETSNSFYPNSISIKDLAKIGDNELRVVFVSPVNYHRNAFNKLKSKYPSPNDVGEIAIASMSRKPQYQFGWDWALRMTTIGFWEPAFISSYDSNNLTNIKIETDSLATEKAFLSLSATFQQEKKTNYRLESKLFGTKELIAINGRCFKIPLELKNPKLWWPRGHGEAYLYEDEIKIYDENNQLIATKLMKFGIRTSELVQEKDKWGTSFYFKINGKKIFAKGANYIPQDIFPSRISDESTVNLIKQMEISNFNTVRVWGGGFYQKDIFYQTCDEKGIMVWQDLMFACAMYPGDAAFLKSVENELNYQIPRISAHPSVVYFNGNNEVDVAWKNWGFQVKYMISPATQKKMEQDYVNLFKVLAPKVIKKHTKIPYEHTSPLSNWGKPEFFNHGTMHYWGVWHGKDPIEDFGLKTGRFNAEYGFQSFPEFSTISSFSEEKDWDLNSDVMKHHQKSYVGNGMIKKHADILYGKTTDFKEFVYFSQLTQAKAVGIAISGHRFDAPRCMGTLYWQLNDCWQAPTWSSIDYFNNWKALQFQVKKDFEDIAVIELTKEIGKEKYYLISDLDTNFESKVKYKVFDLNGNVLLEKSETHIINNLTSKQLFTESSLEKFQNSNYLIEFEWTNHKYESKKRMIFHESSKLKKAEKSTVTFEISEIDEKNKSAKILIKNEQFIANAWIYSKKLGVSFKENFEHYLPGKHEVEINFIELPKQEDFEMMWR
jgi:beta-mannosidase